MGMYTQIALGVELKRNTPGNVIRRLQDMVKADGIEHELTEEEGRDAEIWSTDRWAIMLCCDSYYFDWQTHFILRHDEIAGTYYLSGTSNLKNYDDEIDKFLDWLTPFIETRGFLGFKQYEEDTLPTLLYLDDNGVIQKIAPTQRLSNEVTPLPSDYERGWRAGEQFIVDQLKAHIGWRIADFWPSDRNGNPFK